ncbi:MAG TPA: hypothetical protein VF658_08035 [Pyrinomonadaceae bacterium]|jgi:hypothetical protein
MIRLTRDRTKVPAGFTGKKRIEKMLLLVEAMRNNAMAFNSGIWKAAKPQLKAESHDKCAYCEAPVATVAHGDVEHFRPKSVYWWLAYCYDNYLYSCQICNQSYKGNEFPFFAQKRHELNPPFPTVFDPGITQAELEALGARFAPDPVDITSGYTLDKFLKDLAKEKAALLDPYVSDPEKFFKWEADPILKEVLLQPLNSKVSSKRAFEAAEKYYGLNRDELKKWRWRVYKEAETLKDVLQVGLPASTETKVKDQLRTMMAPEAEFSGMVRYFVKQVWKLTL